MTVFPHRIVENDILVHPPSYFPFHLFFFSFFYFWLQPIPICVFWSLFIHFFFPTSYFIHLLFSLSSPLYLSLSLSLSLSTLSIYFFLSCYLSLLLFQIMNRYARNLVSLLLSKDPTKRPSLTRVMEHPFLTNKRCDFSILLMIHNIDAFSHY